MELRLVKRYERELLHAIGLNPQDALTQRLIEDYSDSTGLDRRCLDTIKRYVEDYNKLVDADFRLRYYQILALYFTERFFEERTEHTYDERRMLAYWMATGSGKTLVMHLNILQYLAWLDAWKIDFDRLQIILTTPGRNLIAQHRRELEPFVQTLNQRYAGRLELRIDTTQALLQYDDDYFDLPEDGRTQRLILVDEGHIGLSASQEGEFKKLRNRLNARHSFLFEYSATYHNLAKGVAADYEEAIVYDYNYARFYNDGYGKDYFFKEIGPDVIDAEKEAKDNLDECFRVLQDKLQAHAAVFNLPSDKQREHFPIHLPDRPLMAFMGNTVEDPKKAGKEGQDDEVSDVKKVLHYLATLTPEERKCYSSVFHGDITGKLVVTRNREVDDEILLSYGEGEYFGIVNVGNGDSFFGNLDHPEIDKREDAIRSDRYLFQNIDRADSPINVLIGSRKFAEGWNSFRVSVIGLINLGSSKGNKIIQIFGRGVRLRGAKGDGKRTYPDHLEDYYSLGNSDEDCIRKLETLTVFSLRKSYLKTFIKELEKEVPPRLETRVPVTPRVMKLTDGTSVRFKTYRKCLPIFKMGNKQVGLKRVVLSRGTVEYSYLDGETECTPTPLDNFRVSLDYRTDKSIDMPDIAQDVRDLNEAWKDYLDQVGLARHVRNEADRANLLLYARDADGTLRPPTITDLLALVSELRYKPKEALDLTTLDRLNRRLVSNIISKLKNKINYNINQTNYVYDAPLQQQWGKQGGDFIDAYVISTTFPDQEQLQAFEKKVAAAKAGETDETGEPISDPWEPFIEKVRLDPVAEHIYEPLMREPQENLTIKPDTLNQGEVKFLLDLHAYVQDHFAASDRYQFYLLRNVETLKSIGIYLESDEQAFYPDFILWILDQKEKKTFVIFVDPKGETGIRDANLWDISEKAKIGLRDEAHPTLLNLQKKLSEHWKRKVEVHSFLLLRDSSSTGKNVKPDREADKQLLERMLEHKILRLDWHEKKEDGSTSSTKKVPGKDKTYLDIMFESVGIDIPSLVEK